MNRKVKKLYNNNKTIIRLLIGIFFISIFKTVLMIRYVFNISVSSALLLFLFFAYIIGHIIDEVSKVLK